MPQYRYFRGAIPGTIDRRWCHHCNIGWLVPSTGNSSRCIYCRKKTEKTGSEQSDGRLTLAVAQEELEKAKAEWRANWNSEHPKPKRKTRIR